MKKKSQRTRILIRAAVFISMITAFVSLSALEEKVTLKQAVDSADQVALIQVSDVIRSGNNLETIRADVLETYKGELPASIDLRVLIASRVLNPTGLSVEPGMSWIVLLGRQKDGIYPFSSLSYGKIDLAYNEDTETYYLRKRVTGYGSQYEGKMVSLDEFAKLVQNGN